MATWNGRIEEILGKQIAECSPYFDLMKFEGVPAISSTKYNDLIAKGKQYYSTSAWIHYFGQISSQNL